MMPGPSDARWASEPGKLRAALTYDAAASHFDDERVGFWARIGRRTVERLDLRPGAAVLDVGCGAGASALPAAARVGPTGRVIGIDLSAGLLALARRKARAGGLTQVEFRQADMERPDLGAASFDAVISVFSLFFAQDMERQLRTLWRLVRPGGQLAVTTWGPRMFEPGTALFERAMRRERPDLVGTYRPWERITDPLALLKLFAQAGIPGVEVMSEASRHPLPAPEDWWPVVLGSGLRHAVDQLDEDAAARVRDANLESLRRAEVDAIETNVVYAVATRDQVAH